jgi:membrane protein
MKYGSEIEPNEYAITTKQVEIETGKQSVNQKEQNKDPRIKET